MHGIELICNYFTSYTLFQEIFQSFRKTKKKLKFTRNIRQNQRTINPSISMVFGSRYKLRSRYIFA